MVKHIILWTLKEMSDSEKESVKAGIKEGLEGLKGKIPGLVDIKVNTNGRLPSSTADLMLDSTFESEEALKGYSKHPEHVAVADSKVRPFTASRACLDFEIKTRSRMKLFGRRKAKEVAVQFDSETQYAVIRSSICTGEKVAGFKNKTDGHFTEVMLIRSAADEKEFKETYGVDSLKVEY